MAYKILEQTKEGSTNLVSVFDDRMKPKAYVRLRFDDEVLYWNGPTVEDFVKFVLEELLKEGSKLRYDYEEINADMIKGRLESYE